MAVKSLLHYALEVPDQAVGQRYYRDFGLTDATVASRLRELIDRKILRVRAVVDWDLAGLKAPTSRRHSHRTTTASSSGAEPRLPEQR